MKIHINLFVILTFNINQILYHAREQECYHLLELWTLW
jgi:hypothetical protein